MAININSNTSYDLSHDSSQESKKCVLYVKLTDSCLVALEEYLSYKTAIKGKAKIRFDSSTGEINIPSKPGSASKHVWKKFNFASTALHLGGRQGGMECIEQARAADATQLESLGVARCKLAVMATDDVYEMTRTKMAQADQERKEVRTKEIKINHVKSGKKKTISAPNSRLLTAVKRKVTSNNSSLSKTSNGVNGNSHPTKSIKQWVIQILALKPHKKLELIGRLEREGASSKARDNIGNVLKQVANFSDNTFRLMPHLYREVELNTWPYYNDQERLKVKRNVELLKRAEARQKEAPSPSATTKSPEEKGVKRPAPAVNRSAPFVKKPRISPPLQDFRHSPNMANDRTNQTSRQPTVNADQIIRIKNNNNVTTKGLPLVEHGTSKLNINDENKNGNKERENSPPKTESTSETPSYMLSYITISTYDQRCRYKKDFQSEYGLYRKLKEETDAVTMKFVELDRSWRRFQPDSKDAQKIQEEICRLYEQHQKDTEFQERKKRCQQLQAKLAHIKRLVVDYDNAAVVKDDT